MFQIRVKHEMNNIANIAIVRCDVFQCENIHIVSHQGEISINFTPIGRSESETFSSKNSQIKYICLIWQNMGEYESYTGFQRIFNAFSHLFS